MNVANTKYEIVRFVGKKLFNFKLTRVEDEEWDLCWCDGGVTAETLSKMKPYQKINHFPGMSSLSRKNYLARNLIRMKRAFPSDYKFFPMTWLLPTDWPDFRAQFNNKKKNKPFIVKPEASCQGKGIFLTRNCEDIDSEEHYVAQRYLSKPYLIDGLKFDLRIYVLLYGCDPLRIFLFKEGLARFSTERYTKPSQGNMNNLCMHLTNYAINKNSDKFLFNQDANYADTGHKRCLPFIWDYIDSHGGNSQKVLKNIEKAIIKTICGVQPSLSHIYNSCQPDDYDNGSCFEILGILFKS